MTFSFWLAGAAYGFVVTATGLNSQQKLVPFARHSRLKK
jgi:hypothetical protein